MRTLWSSDAPADWDAALARYPEVIERQGVARLPELDRWYREELPGAITGVQYRTGLARSGRVSGLGIGTPL